MSSNVHSRRSFLKSLSLCGLAAGLYGVEPLGLNRALAASTPVLDTMSETRLLMGTIVTITVSDASSSRMAEGLNNAFTRMEELCAIFNRHEAGTALSVLNSQGALRDVPPPLHEVLQQSLMFARLTENAFNSTVQPLVDIFRHHKAPHSELSIPESALQAARQAIVADMSTALEVTDRGVRLTRADTGLTLDGIAKGYIVDEASLALTALGLDNHLVSAGGDLIARGRKNGTVPWMVGIRNPHRPSAPGRTGLVGKPLALENAALATSGGYRIYFDAARQYHHLVDPARGVSPSQTASVSVIGRTTMEADALATACSILPVKDSLKLISALPGRECFLVTDRGKCLTSSGWPASV